MTAPIQMVELSRIQFTESDRIRQDLDPDSMRELAESIEQIGLLNPIIITRDYKLIAGRRRLEAHKYLKRKDVAVRIWEDLDEVTRLIIELDENRKRKQLSWVEEVGALQRIHILKSRENLHWTLGETAALTGVSTSKLSEDLFLHSYSDNKRVQAKPTRTGALLTAKRERELEIVRELAKRRSDQIVPDSDLPHETSASGTIYLGDCRKLLSSLADESVDLIVTDPPWGVNFQSSTQWAKHWAPTYDDSWEGVQEVMRDTLPHWFRVLKEGCHFYTFFGASDHGWWIKALTDVGFMVRARPLVWYKAGQPAITDLYTSFQTCYETVLWGWKPGEGEYRNFFQKSIAEGYSIPRSAGEWHINEKPLELIEKYVEASTAQGELVLDPFLGGGTTALAAFQLGRMFIGCEQDEGAYTMCLRRLREAEAAEVAKA